MILGGEVPGILDFFGQLRVMQQRAQGGEGWRFYGGGHPWRAGLITITAPFAILVPRFLVPFLASCTGFLRRPFLLRHIHFLCLRLMIVAVIGHRVVIDARVVGRRCFLRGALCQLTHRFTAQAGDFAQALAHQGAQVGARDFVDQRRGEGGHMGLALKRARVGFFRQLLEEVIGQWLRVLVDPCAKGVGAFGADQSVRVLAFGQEQKACATTVLQARKCRLQRPPCRIAAGLVAVEAEQHAGHDAKQPLEVFLAGGGAQGRDGIAQALLGQGNDVHVALDDDDLVEVAVGLARFIQAVEFLAFMENRGFRGVQVFRLVVAQYPAAEGDDAPATVADRKHHAVAEAVVAFTAFGVFDQQAGIDHGFLLQGIAAQVLEQVVPARWGKTQAEVPGDFAGQPATFQVFHGGLARWVAFQGLAIKVGSGAE
ncbi:hypothetical protein D3C85_967270 [compost metagenome]